MHFTILGEIYEIELIASGHGINNLTRLNKVYGHSNWKKLKGIASIRIEDGTVIDAELHWYEGHGLGKKEFKIKRYLL